MHKKKLSLVISGGAARSITHAGVLAELESAQIKPHEIVATSTGAIIAAAYACGTLDLLREDIYKHPNLSFWKLLALGGWERGIVDADVHYKNLQRYTQGKKFEQTDVSLAFVATDLSNGEQVVIDSGDIATGIQATMSFPGLYPPVIIDDKLLADGGIVALLPDAVARARGADIVISVESTRNHSTDLINAQKIYRRYQEFWLRHLPEKARRNIMNFTYGVARENMTWPIRYALEALGIRDQQRTLRCCMGSVAMMTIKALKTKHDQGYTRDTDIFIQPNILDIERLDFKAAHECEMEGARCARNALPYLRQLLVSPELNQINYAENTLHRD